jgi:hypothetical protein
LEPLTWAILLVSCGAQSAPAWIIPAVVRRAQQRRCDSHQV